jgi:hypothetical protein
MANLFSKIDFEGNNLSQFTSTASGTDYALAAAAGAARNGSYGARATATSASDTNNSAKGLKTFTAAGTGITVVDAEMRFSSWTGAGYLQVGSKALMLLNASSAGRVAWLAVRGTRLVELCYRNTGFSDVASGLTLTMTLNTWYRLRIIHDKAAGSLVFKYSTNGGSSWTTVGTVASGVRADNIDEAHAGVVQVNNWEQAQYTVDMDDMEGWDAEPVGGLPPNAPTLDSATPGNAQVSLAWSAPSGGAAPTGYKVKRGTSPGVYGTTIDVGNVTSYVNTGLSNGTTYYYQIVAYNAAGDGTGSNELSATPAAGATPSAPTLTSLVPTNTQIIATWGAVAGATGYKVRIGTSSGSYGAAVDVGNVTTHTFTGLTNGTTYYVIVIAYNANGDSGNSNELSAAPTAASRIQTKYNDMAVGDIVFLEKPFTFEALQVLQHATPDSGKVYKSTTVNGVAGYEFEVSRNLDGTGKNDWLAGDSYVNTGAPGSGFIDQYSYTSALARPLEFITLNGTLADSFAVDYPLLTGSGSIAAFGVSNTKWDGLFLTLATPAIYTTATIVYEYWNGSAWATLPATVSVFNASNAAVTNDWKTAGSMSIIFTPPANWAATTIASQSAYWIRIRVSAATGWSQNPKQGGGRWATRGKRQYGPAIAMWRRMSTAWNDLRESAAIGNLEGYYDYGTRAMGAAFGDPTANWLAIDAINGIRIMRGSVKLGQWDAAGNLQLGQVAASKANIYFDAATGELRFRTNTTSYMLVRADGRLAFAQGAAPANSVNWEMTNGETVAQVYGARVLGRSYATLISYGYSGAAGITELVAFTPNNSSGFARLYLDGNSKQIVAENPFTASGGLNTPSASITNFLLVGNYSASQFGGIGAGRTTKVYTPTISDWPTESTLILTAGNNNLAGGYSVIAFHEAGQRVDFIRTGAGVMTLGHNGGFGSARVEAPGGISTAYNMTAQVIASATAYGALIVPIERNATIRQWTMAIFVNTTNNGSNYWLVSLKRVSDAATIDSFTTAAIPASTWTRVGRALSVSATTGHGALYVDIEKVGSPGNIQCTSMLYMQ